MTTIFQRQLDGAIAGARRHDGLDGESVSVIIPYRPEEPYLDRTIGSVSSTAVGQVEILPIEDRDACGIRWAYNQGAARATGDYLFFLDAHCRLSCGWDAALKAAAADHRTIGVCVIDGLEGATWRLHGKHHDAAILRDDFVVKWASRRQRETQEIMAFTGCGWLIAKTYYDWLGGADETLGPLGGVGAEWSLKAWLSGGRVVLAEDVICGHVFRDRAPYTFEPGADPVAELRRRYGSGYQRRQSRPVAWLFARFGLDPPAIDIDGPPPAAEEPPSAPLPPAAADRNGGCRDCSKVTAIVRGFGAVIAERVLGRNPAPWVVARAAQCAACEYRTFLGWGRWAIGFVTRGPLPIDHRPDDRQQLWCSICKCCVEAKIRVPTERCPLPEPRWGEVAQAATGGRDPTNDRDDRVLSEI